MKVASRLDANVGTRPSNVSSASYKRLARVPVVFDLSPLPFPSSAPMSKTTRARDATAADYIPMTSGERSTPSDLIVDTEREYYYQSSRPNRPSWSFWIGPWLMHGLLIVVYMTILLPRSCKTADAAISSQTSKSGKCRCLQTCVHMALG